MDQPYQAPLSSEPPFRPNYRSSSPATIGVLNIVFGIGLLLCGGCMGFYTLMLSNVAPFMAGFQQQMQAEFEADRQERIDSLEEELASAETDEEKAAIEQQIDAVETQPVPMPDVAKMYGMHDSRVQAYAYIDILSGLFLNLVLIVCGIGLVRYQEWARVTAVWLAVVKILRLLVLEGVFIVVIAPIMAQGMVEAMAEMQQNLPGQGGGPPPAEFARAMGITYTAMAVGMIVLGCIYPVIVLITLTRPSAKEACQPQSPGPPSW